MRLLGCNSLNMLLRYMPFNLKFCEQKEKGHMLLSPQQPM